MMILAVLLCLTLLGPLAVSAFVCLSSGSRILSSEDAAQLQADCILVPGALVRKNGQLSGILADRMTVGIALYHAGASDRMLLSGDHGRADYNEVGAMKDYAAARDVRRLEAGPPAEPPAMRNQDHRLLCPLPGRDGHEIWLALQFSRRDRFVPELYFFKRSHRLVPEPKISVHIQRSVRQAMLRDGPYQRSLRNGALQQSNVLLICAR